ncbi:aminotransferase class IV [uncultured Senegalimassilia sp.]|uniref:aminotransferase class IV n=1 Tax=uncultured Senegalimassilia sp. TaxID=1714350 RepID=UPI002615062D|nr:aminotransferase class IV [uncultured Senegalimassilia sp.]
MKAHEQIFAPDAEGRAYADDGLFFGIGAFETIAVSGQTPLFLDEHLARMEETLRFFGIEAAQTDLKALALRACAELDPAGEWALKLTASNRNRIVTIRRNPYADPGAKRAFSCDFSTVRRNESSPLVRMKTLAYAESVIEKRRAHERGIDEPLFLNTRGEVAEGAVSNIFAVIGGNVVTPPVSCGLLPGIMRRRAIELTGAIERPLTTTELTAASEVFLTNSLMGAMPVTRLGKTRFEPGPVSHLVNQAYADQVHRRKKAVEDGNAKLAKSADGIEEGGSR